MRSGICLLPCALQPVPYALCPVILRHTTLDPVGRLCKRQDCGLTGSFCDDNKTKFGQSSAAIEVFVPEMLQEHWLAVRKVEGSWYNFNSLFPAPQV